MTPDVSDAGALFKAVVSTAAEGAQISLSGELDVSTISELRRAFTGIICRNGTPVIVDLTDLSFCDARGLSELLLIDKVLSSHGCLVRLVGASPAFRRLAQITGADLVLDVR